MSQKEDIVLRNLSRHQYGALKAISHGNVTLVGLRAAHGNTLGSLAYNDWIRRVGHGEDSPVILTWKGQEELRAYEESTMPTRAMEHDITERCMRLLRVTRNVVAMKTVA